jgi:hypothetical protein
MIAHYFSPSREPLVSRLNAYFLYDPIRLRFHDIDRQQSACKLRAKHLAAFGQQEAALKLTGGDPSSVTSISSRAKPATAKVMRMRSGCPDAAGSRSIL